MLRTLLIIALRGYAPKPPLLAAVGGDLMQVHNITANNKDKKLGKQKARCLLGTLLEIHKF